MEMLVYVTNTKERGYITLVSVLVVGAVGAAIATSLILLGLSSSRTSFALEQSDQAKALADACVEEALRVIRDNSSYTGTDGFSLGQGTCSYTVTDLGGENRELESTGTVGTVVRKAEINIDTINPQLSILSWEELADF